MKSNKEKVRSELITSYQFWLIAAILLLILFLHYYTAQTRLLPVKIFGIPVGLSRHAVERILMVLPVAYAALNFGLVGGLVTLFLAILIMLPRALLLSPWPMDSLFEIMAVALVGGLMSWLAEIQRREKRMRQKIIEDLEAVNVIFSILTRSLELKQILDDVLEKVLEVMKVEAAWIFLLDEKAQELVFKAHRGLSEELVSGADRLKVGEGLNGWVAQSGEPLLVKDASNDPRVTREAVRREGLQALLIVPLRAKGRIVGTLGVAMHSPRRFLPEEVNLLATIGNQIGIAVENTHLYENMRFYVRGITKAQEEERKRIARELHDDTAQALIALSRRLDALEIFREQLPEPVIKRLEDLRELSDNILQNVRRFSRDLRPPALDDLGLLPALESLVAELTAQDGMEAEFKVLGEKKRLSPETELILYRIIQEALSNVRRHSQASKVVVSVEFYDAKLRIMVSDNGKGFEQLDRLADLAATGKLGLLGMHERARLLNGTLTICSAPGQGTTIVVDVPI